jgi:hypothetical protein
MQKTWVTCTSSSALSDTVCFRTFLVATTERRGHPPTRRHVRLPSHRHSGRHTCKAPPQHSLILRCTATSPTVSKTRPGIAYTIEQACLHKHDPHELNLTLIKRIRRYVKGTLTFGLQLHASLTTNLTAYFDADWVGCLDSRCSISGFCVYLRYNHISWSSKRHTIVS